ncbi:hypothetical protein Tco_0615482 [Tanacetum coccineum]
MWHPRNPRWGFEQIDAFLYDYRHCNYGEERFQLVLQDFKWFKQKPVGLLVVAHHNTQEEDENKPELTFPYEEAYSLNPPPPASDSEPEDVIEVEDTVEPEDETVPASVHEVGESSTATFLREDGDRLLPGFMRMDIDSLFGRIASLSRRVCGHETADALVKKKGKAKDKYYGKLIADLGNEVRSSVEEGATAMENLVRNLGNAEEGAECKKLKKELEEARFSNTLLRMQNERVKLATVEEAKN